MKSELMLCIRSPALPNGACTQILFRLWFYSGNFSRLCANWIGGANLQSLYRCFIFTSRLLFTYIVSDKTKANILFIPWALLTVISLVFSGLILVNPRQMQMRKLGSDWYPTTNAKLWFSLSLFSTSPHYPCGILSLSGKVCSLDPNKSMKVARGGGGGVAYFWFPISSTCASSFLLESFSLHPLTSMAVLICMLNIGFVWNTF